MKKFFKGILVFSILFLLVGCLKDKVAPETPEQALGNALNAVKNLNKNEADKYLDYDKLLGVLIQDGKEIESIKYVAENMNYKIIESKVEGDKANVKVEITNIDMKEVAAETVVNIMGAALENSLKPETERKGKEELEKGYSQILYNNIAKLKDKTITRQVDLVLVKNRNSWKINNNDELGNAIMGDFLMIVDKLSE